MVENRGEVSSPSGSCSSSSLEEVPETKMQKENVFIANLSEKMGDYYRDAKGNLCKTEGLTWWMASLFVIADMAGGGIVALPTAVVRLSFYFGLSIIALMAIIAGTSSVLLGNCWSILLRRFPEYRTHCRKPYAEISYRAMGPFIQKASSASTLITQFGACVVFLLLSAKNISDFLSASFELTFDYCFVILIASSILLPVTLLKSPQNFWPVVVGGMCSTIFAVLLICIGSTIDFSDCSPAMQMPELKFGNILIALGTVFFSYGGHSAFPTIQHDMRRPHEFKKTSILSFSVIFIMTCAVSIFAAKTYGSSLNNSVINSIQTIWIQVAINLLITAHCLLTVTLIINPLNQEAEEYFRIPQGFGYKRVLVRGCIMGFVVFIATTLPRFDAVLELIGSSTITLTSVIFPCLFYLYLSAAEQKAKEEGQLTTDKNPKAILELEHNGLPMGISVTPLEPIISFSEVIQRTEKKMLISCALIIVVGSIVGTVATVSAIRSITVTEFIAPCYLAAFFPKKIELEKGIYRCCGHGQNISRHHSLDQDSYCFSSNFKFF